MNKFYTFLKGAVYGFGAAAGTSGGTLSSILGDYEFVCDLLSLRKIPAPETDKLYEKAENEQLRQKMLRERQYEQYLEYKRERKTNLIIFAVAAVIGVFVLCTAYTALFAKYPVSAAMLISGFVSGGIPLLVRNVTKEGKPFLYLIPFAVIPCAGVIIVSFLWGASTQPVTVTQTPKPGDGKITVVTVKNETKQTISDWVITFPEGRVETASGTRLVYEKTFAQSITSLIRPAAEHEKNAFTGNDANKTIPPKSSVTFTYGSRMGTRLPLETRMSYKIDARVFITLLFAAVSAGFAVNTPGLSASAVFSVFGVGSTVSSALQNINILALAPCVLGVPSGIILAAKIGCSLADKHRKNLYATLTGLAAGGAVSLLPRHPELKPDFFVGIGLFIFAAAVSVALGMERKSSDDYNSIMNDK